MVDHEWHEFEVFEETEESFTDQREIVEFLEGDEEINLAERILEIDLSEGNSLIKTFFNLNKFTNNQAFNYNIPSCFILNNISLKQLWPSDLESQYIPCALTPYKNKKSKKLNLKKGLTS